MTSRKTLISIAGLLVWTLSACGRDSEETAQPDPEAAKQLELNSTYSEKVAPIVAAKCTPCHAEGGKLNAYSSNQQLLRDNRGPVLDRINRESTAAGFMPPTKSGKVLDEQEKKIITDFLSL